MYSGTVRHMRSASWSGASVVRHELQEDSAMTLPENQHPKPADFHTIPCLAGNVASNQATIDCILPKGAVLPLRGNTSSRGTEVREALASLDGSPLAEGLAPSPNLGQHVVAAGAFHFFAPPTSSANPPGRKRSVDISVFDEFRTRDTYQVDHQPCAGLNASVAAPASRLAGSGDAGGSSSSRSIGHIVETVVDRSVPVPDALVSASSASIEQAHVEDVSSSDGEWSAYGDPMEDQENVPFPADTEVPLTNPGTHAGAGGGGGVVDMSERAPLHDVALSEMPMDYQQHPYSDIESDDDDGDMQGWNLADNLEERIRNNVDGRYDFEIYCDP